MELCQAHFFMLADLIELIWHIYFGGKIRYKYLYGCNRVTVAVVMVGILCMSYKSLVVCFGENTLSVFKYLGNILDNCRQAMCHVTTKVFFCQQGPKQTAFVYLKCYYRYSVPARTCVFMRLCLTIMHPQSLHAGAAAQAIWLFLMLWHGNRMRFGCKEESWVCWM